MTREWTAGDAAAHIAVPGVDDDKYSRGVLGIISGSAQYPGAAVLGVDAALRTGVGMVRYLGPERAANLVLARRPETVTAPGRVQAWLLGSGMDHDQTEPAAEQGIATALGSGVPVVLDGGLLHRHTEAQGPTVVTPHHGELARLLGVDREAIAADPPRAAARAAEVFGVTVALKGNTTHIATPDGTRMLVRAPTTWLATAGTGDSLAGILGALVATHAAATESDSGLLARLAATACLVHGLAAERASQGGPITVLDLNEALRPVIAGLVATGTR